MDSEFERQEFERSEFKRSEFEPPLYCCYSDPHCKTWTLQLLSYESNCGFTFQIVGQIIDDIVVRTCQYCGKVVDDVKDLPGHYTTKGCVAKKYQMQNGDVKSSETPVVIENAEDDIDEQIVPSDMEHGKQIILSDIEHDKHSTEATLDWGYNTTSQNGGGDAFDLVASQPSFVNAISYDDNVTPVMVQSVVHADAFSAL